MSFDPFTENAAPFTSIKQATDYLEQACGRFGAENLSYWSVRLLDGLPDEVTWIATYSPEYMSHYMRSYTPAEDPIFTGAALKRFVIDWSDLNATGAIAQSIHAEAKKYGISTHGLSFPFRSQSGSSILFSATANCTDAQWPERRRTLAIELHLFAHHFHLRADPLVNAGRMNMVSVAA